MKHAESDQSKSDDREYDLHDRHRPRGVGFRVESDRGCREMSIVAHEDEIDEVFGREEWQDRRVDHYDADDDKAQRTPDEDIIKGGMDECPTDEVGGEGSLVLLLREGRVTATGPIERALTSENLSATFGCPIQLLHEDGRYWTRVQPGEDWKL